MCFWGLYNAKIPSQNQGKKAKLKFLYFFSKNMLTFNSHSVIIIYVATRWHAICESGGIGRRARLRCVWETIRVQVPSLAPNKTDYFDRIVSLIFIP